MKLDFMIQTMACKEVKGLELLKTKHLKTRTDITVTVGEKEHPNMLDARGEIKLLGLEGKPIQSIMVTAQGIKYLGYVVNRSVPALKRIQLTFGDDEPLPWNAKEGVVSLSGIVPITGSDLPFILHLIHRMATRAKTNMGGTHHPLSLYDLKQCTGIIYGIQCGEGDAKAMDKWMVPRELMYLEGVKAAKAKAKSKSKTKSKTKSKPSDLFPPPGSGIITNKEDKTKGKPKTAPKAKGKANLGNLE